MNLMLDLETLSVRPNAVITQIGAVIFDESEILADFKCNIDINDSMSKGFHVDGNTITWWLKQSEEARRSIYSGEKLPVKEALKGFYKWVTDNVTDLDNLKVWGNGSDFDNAILAYHLHHLGSKPFWKFYNNRCFRTFLSFHPDAVRVVPEVAHDAMEDAKAQAMTVLNFWKE